MEKPTIENIDQWMFDAVEGNLDAAQMTALDELLAAHPEILEEKTLWEASSLTPEEVVFPNTNDYIRTPFWWNYKTYAAAAILLLISWGTYSYFTGGNQETLLASQSAEHKMVWSMTAEGNQALTINSKEDLEPSSIETSLIAKNVLANKETKKEKLAANRSSENKTSSDVPSNRSSLKRIEEASIQPAVLSAELSEANTSTSSVAKESQMEEKKEVKNASSNNKLNSKEVDHVANSSDEKRELSNVSLENQKVIKEETIVASLDFKRAGEINWVEPSGSTKIGPAMRGSYLPKSNLSSNYDNSAMARLKRLGKKMDLVMLEILLDGMTKYLSGTQQTKYVIDSKGKRSQIIWTGSVKSLAQHQQTKSTSTGNSNETRKRLVWITYCKASSPKTGGNSIECTIRN